jgi:hypothetical protein
VIFLCSVENEDNHEHLINNFYSFLRNSMQNEY